jgi:purine-nucleoside phosphorylase
MEAVDGAGIPAVGGAGKDMKDDFALAETAAEFLRLQTTLRPTIGLVLGSGLGGFADELSEATRIPYASIPSFPRSTAIGHAGQMVIGKVGDISVAAMQGRVHLYEGYSPSEVVFPPACLAEWEFARSS